MSRVTLQTATEQLRLLGRGEISALELAEEHIRQIDLLNPRLHALVDFDRERVLAQARMRQTGPLAGLPVTVKSSIAAAGHLCETGSALHRGRRPSVDAEAVRRLRAAGATLLGTTNCPELLMAYETGNLLYGDTRNPWNTDYASGGSSGGEAVAIATGMSAGGLGSDSGGSIRQPAAYNGICALKPTPGRVPGAGHLPANLGPFSFLGAVGPMARTVGDLSLFFEVLTGHDDTDPVSAPVPLRSISPEAATQYTVGWFEDDGLVPVTGETREAVSDAARALEQQGFRVERFRPEGLEEARRLWHTFFVQCGAMLYEPVIRGHEQEMSPVFRGFLDIAQAQPPLSAASLLDAWVKAGEAQRRLLEQMRDYPVLLCPVCAVPGFRPGERAWTIDGTRVDYLDAMRYTQWFNLLAAPAAVVPVGHSAAGLPVGVQIAARPWADELVLAVAAAIERAFGYQPPPLCTEAVAFA